MSDPTACEIVENSVLNGRVRLRQRARGYRPGLDAALLAAAVATSPGRRMIEAGCGVGGALLPVAVRRPDAHLTGLERDLASARLARANAALNAVSDRVAVIDGDASEGFAALGLPAFDVAFANPPYFDDPGALRSPSPDKRHAWIADDGLQAWTDFLLKAVREGGHIVVIHRADRLADLLALLAPKAGSFAIRPVQPHADQPAKRVLLRAIKTGKAPMTLLPPLVLHDHGGAKHSARAEAILRGEALLPFRA